MKTMYLWGFVLAAACGTQNQDNSDTFKDAAHTICPDGDEIVGQYEVEIAEEFTVFCNSEDWCEIRGPMPFPDLYDTNEGGIVWRDREHVYFANHGDQHVFKMKRDDALIDVSVQGNSLWALYETKVELIRFGGEICTRFDTPSETLLGIFGENDRVIVSGLEGIWERETDQDWHEVVITTERSSVAGRIERVGANTLAEARSSYGYLWDNELSRYARIGGSDDLFESFAPCGPSVARFWMLSPTGLTLSCTLDGDCVFPGISLPSSRAGACVNGELGFNDIEQIIWTDELGNQRFQPYSQIVGLSGDGQTNWAFINTSNL